ncbi:MAG TPA: TonB-dependent receptor plug domain-containing protein [Rhizomicrobium sp.]|nr:TonB-dependent receptor plug domain-containing protein [Rhizomicrobium sp.]
MSKNRFWKTALLGSAVAALATAPGFAADVNVRPGDLGTALDSFIDQTGMHVFYSSSDLRGITTKGVKGNFSADRALDELLSDTGFVTHRDGAVVEIVRGRSSSASDVMPMQLAQAAPARAAVETVTVTSSKLGGADVQSIPIAITALSQEQLTATQTAGGPDLIKQVPNMTFTKTNFSGYSIQLRGIGTQAISVTTDPAVAVAFNDMPFIRNHFFEQEFFDVSQVEVLRGPQGTLYGRNATAGVVNLTSAKPTDQFEAMASADIGNYKNRRFEGMINLPIVDDRLDLRVAGEWTKRNGYSFNSLTDSPIDGRDLWSGRATVRFKPIEALTVDFVWEHFQEDDDRIRSSKQLCKRDNGPEMIGGFTTAQGSDGKLGQEFLSQGCLPASLYSPESYQVPNALSLPYYGGLIGAGFGQSIGSPISFGPGVTIDPYASVTQSTDLRVIESALDPAYRAKNNVFQLNVDYSIAPSLTFISSTGYNNDFLWSTEDYNRFNTRPGIFNYLPANYGTLTQPDGNYLCTNDGTLSIGGNNCAGRGVPTGIFCDPQLGCSNRLVAEDLVEEHAWQFNQEFRLASSFSGPINFSVGGNYMHYETEENYFVFFNTLTAYNAKGIDDWNPSDPSTMQCLTNKQLVNPNNPGAAGFACGWTDTGPIDDLDYQGHNYFLSQNPYVLNSYAGFGEAYYNVLDDLKLTGGLRWTDDQKHFVDIPSALLTQGYGYVVTGVLDQEWKEWTGRFAANWTPKLDFTDQTLIYGTFGHGYKAGGANPPGALFTLFQSGTVPSVTHPLTFDPEFINAYELGTKNTLLDGALTLNGNFFYYDYKGYQISEIVDRTSINLNFDATVKGAELEAKWEPLPGLRFSFSGGYEQTRLNDGSKAVDLMDRTAGNPDWVLVKPFVSQASNCVLPVYVVAYLLNPIVTSSYAIPQACGYAYANHNDPVTNREYESPPVGNTVQGRPIPPGTYPGFDPLAGSDADHPYTGQNTWNGIDYGPAPNNGAGFYKDLSGNELPNAPHFTTSISAEYSMPVTSDWAATLHGDFYWQSGSWARVFNDDPYDKIRGYKNVNLALILTNQDGWQAVGYLKNVFNVTAITGTFLNSDDSGLTTNVFLTDPRLFGVRITKNW